MSQIEYFTGSTADAVVVPRLGLSFAIEHEKPMGKSVHPTAASIVNTAPGANPSAVQPNQALYPAISGDIMPWGQGNDFPQRITSLYSKDPIIPTTLGKIAAMVQGRGIIPVLEYVDDDGDPLYKPLPQNDVVAAEIYAYLSSRYHKQYMREMASDATMYFNGFPEMLISKDRRKIVQLHPLNAEEARWCQMDKAGNLPHIYLSADWPRATVDTAKQITAIDPFRYDAVDWLRDRKEYNVVYPIRFPTPGQRYYALPHHYSLVESGWLDVHLAVPQFKKYMLKNQMSIKYHIKVDEAYWPLAFGDDWNKAKTKPGERQKLIEGWLEKVTKMLTNVENTGQALITQVKAATNDPTKVADYVTITPIQDPSREGQHLADNLEAAANIFYALNVDPTLVGFAGGDKMGARSGGSDKLQAYLIALQMLSPFRDMLIEPVDFMADFNGWKAHFPRLKWIYPDQNPSAKKGDQKKEEPKSLPAGGDKSKPDA